MKKNRENALDAVTGMMVVWMVIYHIFQWSRLTMHPTYTISLQWLFCFMSWFYFKSGMFHKNSADQSFSVYVVKSFNSLIVPLFIWMCVGYVVSLPNLIFVEKVSYWKIVAAPVYKLFRWGDIYGNSPLWFLCSLFFVKIFGYFFLYIKQYLLLIMVLLLIIAGAVLSQMKISLPLGMHNVILGLIFYYFGYAYKVKISGKKIPLTALLVLSSLFVLINYTFPSYVDFRINQIKYGSYVGYIVYSLIMLFILVQFFGRVRLVFLSWIGMRSMYILVLHWPILTLMKTMCDLCRFDLIGVGMFFVFLIGMIIFLGASLFFVPQSAIYCNKFHITAKKIASEGFGYSSL